MTQKMRDEKKLYRSFEIMDTLVRQDMDEVKKQTKAEKARRDAEEMEKKLQTNVGVVEKPSVIGRFKYKMRKTDFQMEDELAPSLRQLRAQGTDDLLRDRFDSVFRRNLVELDAPTVAEKKRQLKRSFKFQARRSQAYGNMATKLAKKNAQKKRANDDKESHNFLKNDMILI